MFSIKWQILMKLIPIKIFGFWQNSHQYLARYRGWLPIQAVTNHALHWVTFIIKDMEQHFSSILRYFISTQPWEGTRSSANCNWVSIWFVPFILKGYLLDKWENCFSKQNFKLQHGFDSFPSKANLTLRLRYFWVTKVRIVLRII